MGEYHQSHSTRFAPASPPVANVHSPPLAYARRVELHPSNRRSNWKSAGLQGSAIRTPRTHAVALPCEYSTVERRADRVAHVLGVTASVLGLVWLVLTASRYPSTLMTISFALYGGALVSCFFASAAYHEASHPRLKNVLRVVDHSMIYLLIAGTYTPVALVALSGTWGWALFAVEWFFATLGIALKVVFPRRFEGVSIACYLALGWAGLVVVGRIIDSVPAGGLACLVAGGLLFTIGVYFHAVSRFRFHTVVWHGFVVAGAACHVCMTLFYIRIPS